MSWVPVRKGKGAVTPRTGFHRLVPGPVPGPVLGPVPGPVGPCPSETIIGSNHFQLHPTPVPSAGGWEAEGRWIYPFRHLCSPPFARLINAPALPMSAGHGHHQAPNTKPVVGLGLWVQKDVRVHSPASGSYEGHFPEANTSCGVSDENELGKVLKRLATCLGQSTRKGKGAVCFHPAGPTVPFPEVQGGGHGSHRLHEWLAEHALLDHVAGLLLGRHAAGRTDGHCKNCSEDAHVFFAGLQRKANRRTRFVVQGGWGVRSTKTPRFPVFGVYSKMVATWVPAPILSWDD